MTGDGKGVLAGLRVADFTANVAGPYCTMLLADLGAEVVKVERIGSGDTSRSWGAARDDGRSFLYLSLNRSKKSLALDLKSERGIGVARRLLATSDIAVVSYGAGAADKLGIGHAAAAALNPALVYCSITGYGGPGPLSGDLGYDMTLQGDTGIMSMTGEEGRPPARVPVSALDITTGSLAQGAILAALLERAKSGMGQHVQASLYQSAMNLLGYVVPQYSLSGDQPGRFGGEVSYAFPYGVVEASDAFFILAVSGDAAWSRLCGCLEVPELAHQEPFTTPHGRLRHRNELREILRPLFRRRTAVAWVNMLRAARIPATLVLSVGEAIDHPHAHESGALAQIPGLPRGARMAATPTKMQRGQAAYGEPPVLGRHSVDVLRSLGYAAQDIDSMLALGVVAAGRD